jgi:type IV secretory pathway VirB2 component (pilin)
MWMLPKRVFVMNARRRARLALAAPAALLAMASPAFASTGASAMPWDTILTTVEADLTGPVAGAVGVICCVIFGLSMAFGHEGSSLNPHFPDQIRTSRPRRDNILADSIR